MPLRNIRMCTTGKLFLLAMFIAAVGACDKSLPPSSKQETAPAKDWSDELIPDFSSTQKQADTGDANAQYELGVIYDSGSKDVPKDASKAVEWYQKAAAQGHTGAQGNLGRLYHLGKL